MIDYTYFWMLNQNCLPGINLTWPWCIILYILFFNSTSQLCFPVLYFTAHQYELWSGQATPLSTIYPFCSNPTPFYKSAFPRPISSIQPFLFYFSVFLSLDSFKGLYLYAALEFALLCRFSVNNTLCFYVCKISQFITDKI